ncbi:MAG: hypothetical protein ACRECS_16345, partial [Sphingomonas sp.]
MKALISGQAGIAAVIRESVEFRPIHDAPFAGTRADIHSVLGGFDDIETHDVATIAIVDRLLGEAWAQDRSLFLLFLLIEKMGNDSTEISETIEDLVHSYKIKARLLGTLRAIQGAEEFLTRAIEVARRHPELRDYIRALFPEITARALARHAKDIRVAVVGIGNCASSLVQGLAFYHKGSNDHVGLMHWDLGGYKPSDIKVVAAWDVDTRKVGVDVSDAIFTKPNCAAVFCADVPPSGVKVKMGNVLDGVADHMADYADDRTFIVADLPQPTKAEVVAALRESKADVLMNYLPVGSQKATEFY